MRIEYERACIEAGLSEEKIREIRKVFDVDYKRIKSRSTAMERENITFYSLELLRNPENDSLPFHFADPDADVERIILLKLDLEHLDKILERIPEKDREFILDCFDAEWGGRKWIAEKYGMSLGAIKQKKKRMLKKIRTLFFEGEECNFPV